MYNVYQLAKDLFEQFSEEYKKTIEPPSLKFDKFAPKSFKEYIGQNRIKSIVKDMINSAKIRKSYIDHTLIVSSMPGQGKTSLAKIIAKEMNVPFFNITASAIENGSEIIKILRSVFEYENSILFIDEIHRLKKSLAELLYVPMENIGTEITVPKFISENLFIKPFTLIGATAGEQGQLPKPLLDRFSVHLILDPYNLSEIERIIQRNLKIVGIKLNKTAIKEISRRSLFTPRIAINYLKRIRDYLIANKKNPTKDIVKKVFDRMGIDELGLDNNARIILRIIYSSNKGGIGLDTLSKISGLDKNTISKIYEPMLLKYGLLEFGNKGRTITDKGKEYLKIHKMI